MCNIMKHDEANILKAVRGAAPIPFKYSINAGKAQYHTSEGDTVLENQGQKREKWWILDPENLEMQAAIIALSIFGGVISEFAILGAIRKRENPGADNPPYFKTLPKISVAVSLATTAYFLYIRYKQAKETPTPSFMLLLFAGIIGAVAILMSAGVLFLCPAEEGDDAERRAIGADAVDRPLQG